MLRPVLAAHRVNQNPNQSDSLKILHAAVFQFKRGDDDTRRFSIANSHGDYVEEISIPEQLVLSLSSTRVPALKRCGKR